jgi:hypothetical protein
MRSDIIKRALSVIQAKTSDRRRSKELEEETGIPDRNWKQVWNGRQRPTAHMIEALCRRWPEYAFWVATGITDEKNGHTAPKEAWRCGEPIASEAAEEAARNYFGLKMYSQDIYYGPSEAMRTNYVLKKNPTDAEIEASRAEMKLHLADLQVVLDELYGKDVRIWDPKYTKSLDEAIAQLAFFRRLASFEAQYPGIRDKYSMINVDIESAQLAKLESERLAIRESEASEN